MKKLLFGIAAAALLLASCNKTVGEKAEILIKDNVTENTTYADSYKVIEIKLDSAYAPLENPEIYKLFDKYVRSSNEIMVHYKMITEMQTKMGRFTDKYSNELIAKLDPIIKSLEKHVSLMENFERMLNMPQQLSGYKAIHRYMLSEKGKDVEHSDYVMFNKDMSAVTHTMSLKDYEFADKEIKKLKETIKDKIETYRNTIEVAKQLTE